MRLTKISAVGEDTAHQERVPNENKRIWKRHLMILIVFGEFGKNISLSPRIFDSENGLRSLLCKLLGNEYWPKPSHAIVPFKKVA